MGRQRLKGLTTRMVVCYTGLMAKRTTTINEHVKAARRVDREARKAHDPYFGKRRKAGEHDGPTKAKASRDACRKVSRTDWS